MEKLWDFQHKYSFQYIWTIDKNFVYYIYNYDNINSINISYIFSINFSSLLKVFVMDEIGTDKELMMRANKWQKIF